jgi:HSP20 family protein
LSYDYFENIRKKMLKMLKDVMKETDEIDAWFEGLLNDLEISLSPSQLFNERFNEASQGYLTPIISMHDFNNELLITIDLPGSDPNTIDIELLPDKITIDAQIKEEVAKNAFGQAYWAKKINKYKGVYPLPYLIDPKSAKVTKKNGMIIIKVKKHNQ